MLEADSLAKFMLVGDSQGKVTVVAASDRGFSASSWPFFHAATKLTGFSDEEEESITEAERAQTSEPL